MYFECPAGKEILCRMQWSDIRKYIGQNGCAGFGTLNMLSQATLHPNQPARWVPDVWDLGMGVSGGFFVDGQCPKAQTVCTGDAGVVPDSAADSAGGTSDAASSPDLATEPDVAADAMGPGTGGGSGGASGVSDAGGESGRTRPDAAPDVANSPPKASGACSVTAASPRGRAGLAPFCLLALVLATPRGSRRSR